MLLSSFIFGIPYMSRPPTRSSLSYTVTSWPLWLSWSAAASPEGPEPMIATFLPVLTFGGFGAAYPFAYAVSIIPCSLSLTDTGLPQCPHVHAFSHSAGQTLDVNSGKLLVLCRRLYACSQLPVYTRSFHSGTRLCRGQPDVMPAIVIPDWQKGTPQSIQRAACFC